MTEREGHRNKRLRQRRLLVGVAILIGAVAGALVGYGFFAVGTAPRGDLIDRISSPDGKWEARVFYAAETGWGSDSQRVEVRRTGNTSAWKELYRGEPADMSWRDGDVLVASEHGSGTTHVMHPSLNRGYNSGTDDAVNVIGVIRYMFAAFLFFVVPGLILARVVTRRPTSEGDSGELAA